MIGSWPLSLPNFIGPAGKNGEGARMPQTFIEEANNSRAPVSFWPTTMPIKPNAFPQPFLLLKAMTPF